MRQTASQLIHNAALKTGKIEMHGEKTIEYSDVQTDAVDDAVCWLCGGETGGMGLPTKKAIKPTFTDHPHARGQCSKSICSGCAFCLSMRELRNYSILATRDSLDHPTLAQWREILLNPPVPPFVMCLAVSGQKYLTFKAPINLEREYFIVLLEERPVNVILSTFKFCVNAIEALYVWFSKDEIASGNYSQHKIKECGLRRWEELERNAEVWRGRPVFDLALFVAQKGEKPKEEVPQVGPLSVAVSTRARSDKRIAGQQLTIDGI